MTIFSLYFAAILELSRSYVESINGFDFPNRIISVSLDSGGKYLRGNKQSKSEEDEIFIERCKIEDEDKYLRQRHSDAIPGNCESYR